MIEPFAWAIVCDDYRVEATAKPFLIGIYLQDMVFATLPATLGQLVVATTLASDVSAPITKYSVEVTWPGGKYEQNFDLGPFSPEPPIPGMVMPPYEKVECRSIIPIRPMVVLEPGPLVVLVKHDKGVLRAKMIRMYTQPQPPQAA